MADHEQPRGIEAVAGKKRPSCAGIQTLLGENHDALLARLDNVDGILAKLLSHMEEFGSVVIAINPAAALSEQAISILRQLDQSGSMAFINANIMGEAPNYLYVCPGAAKGLEYTDERFIYDDVATLVRLGLLIQGTHQRSYPQFMLTRAGAALVRAIDAGRNNVSNR